MTTPKLSSLLILVCLLYSISANSQNLNKEVKPLAEILSIAQKQYNITFSYANNTVSTIKIPLYSNNLSLKETIKYLENTTQLKFTFLSSNNILINKKRSDFTVCGFLIDRNAKNFIEGAHIKVLNTSINSITNSKGYFEIKDLNENQIIEISHLSYPTIFLNSTDFLINKNCLTISISQKIEDLEEVVLSNYLTSGISIKTNNTISIDVLKSGILPGLIEPDILRKIQSIPGISSVNETISNINIRGGSNDQNLLLWDGIKMYHSGHFFGLISAFNPYLTHKVSIIKNGTSAQYNNGVSGTINIETINDIKDKTYGGAGFNLLSADAFAHIPISKKIGIQFTGRRSLTDLMNTPTFEKYFDKTFQDSKINGETRFENKEYSSDSKFNFFDYSFKLLYDINQNHKIRFSLLNVENSLDYNETLLLESMAESKTSGLNQKNSAFGLNISNKWSQHFKSSLQAYYTKYNIDASNFSLLNEQILKQYNEVLETGIKLKTEYILNKYLSFLNGYSFSETGITNTEDINLPLFKRTIKNVIRNHGIFSELNLNLNNNTFINGGLRLNYQEKFSTFKLEPRLQILQKINSEISLKLAGEFKSQYSTQIIDLQEDFLGVEKKRWTLSDNDQIPIIKSKQASVGFHYKKNNLFINLEGFYKTVKGITTATQGFQNQNQFIKTSGDYTVKGVEFLINKKSKNLISWLSYTYNKNDYKFLELTPSSFPNNLDIRHSISVGNTYNYKNFNVSLGLLWRTGKPFTTPVDDNNVISNGIPNSIVYNNPNGERLSNYYRVDFSSTYKFKISEKLDCMTGVSVLNILNTNNVLNTYYKLSSSNLINKIDNTSIGLTPNFTFRISY